MSGVSSAGFSPADETEILTGLRDQARALVDANLADPITYPQTTWGSVASIVAKGLRLVWEQGALAYRALDPRYAEGDQLDAIGLLRGTARLTPKPTLVGVTYTIPGVGTYQPGAIVLKQGQDPTLYSNRDAVVAATVGTATFVSTTNTASAPTVGTMTIVSAPAGSSFACSSVTPGVAYEEDADYLARQEASLARAGGSTRDALLADLLAVQGVETADVSMVQGAVVVTLSGSPQAADVWQAMYNNVAGGVWSTGSSSYSAPSPVDGKQLTYYWTVATPTTVTVALSVTTRTALTPTEKTALQTAWKAALAALWSAQAPGATLRLSDVVEAAVTLSSVQYADISSARIQGAFADYALGSAAVPSIGTATLTVSP